MTTTRTAAAQEATIQPGCAISQRGLAAVFLHATRDQPASANQPRRARWRTVC